MGHLFPLVLFLFRFLDLIRFALACLLIIHHLQPNTQLFSLVLHAMTEIVNSDFMLFCRAIL